MKKLSLLFVSLIILGLISTQTLVAGTIHSKGTLTGSVSNAGATTGGGKWSATTTWQENQVPLSTDDVIILSGDVVEVDANGNASSLTVQAGATINQKASITCTSGGAFTLASGSWWYASYGSATKMPQGFGSYNIDPASNWVFTTAASSSLINAIPSNGPIIYGNVFVYKTGAALAAAATFSSINIQGNLTVNVSGSTLKLTNNKSAQNTTIHVGGNIIIIAGVLTGLDAAADWTGSNSNPQTCIVNVDGDVKVGDAGTASGVAGLASVSSAQGSFLRTSTFNISGNLSYINGAKIEAGTSSTASLPSELSIINIGGNLSTDATVAIAANTSGTFQINFVGSSSKTMTLGAPTTQMAFSCNTILGINKTGGANVQLLSPVTIGGHVTLTLTSGKLITTSTNFPTITGSGAVSSGSSSSFVSGPLGYSNVSTSPKSFVYPIGKGSAFRPLTLSLTQSDITPSVYTAEQFEGNANLLGNTVNPLDLSHVSSVRYFNVSELAGGTSFSAGAVTLSYDADDQVTDIANLRVAKDDGATHWLNLGGTVTTGTILSTVPFTSSGNFALANFNNGNNPLPVELASFSAANNGRTVQLNWGTKTEKNSNKFDIQRSSFGSADWTVIGSVKASVLSNSPKSYSYADNKLQSGKYQYRLKMIDNDGSFSYSSVQAAEVAVPKDFAVSQNYPNPFNPSTTIAYQVPVDAKVIMEVYNIAGQKVSELVNQDLSAGYYTANFGGSKLSSGVYIYRVVAIDKASGNNFSSIKKMMLLK